MARLALRAALRVVVRLALRATRKSGLEVGCHPGSTLNRKTAGRWCE
jgi:hypothetical protein